MWRKYSEKAKQKIQAKQIYLARVKGGNSKAVVSKLQVWRADHSATLPRGV